MDPNVPTSFFKIIISPSIDLLKLRIPPAFTKEFESSFLDHVYLKAPGGEKHKVVLRKEERHIWLTNGWEKFADRYSLEFGHFLVFQYKGNSHFDIFIFDKSSMMIDYSNFDTNISDLCENENENEEEADTYEDGDEEEEEDENEYEKEFEDDGKVLVERRMHNKWSRRGKRFSEAYERAKAIAINFENPHFIVSMRASYMSGYHFRMWVRFGFAQVYMEGENMVRLQVETEPRAKTWIVKLTKGSNWVYFDHGWKLFALDNGLEVGDVCVFELINSRDQTYRVHIVRNT